MKYKIIAHTPEGILESKIIDEPEAWFFFIPEYVFQRSLIEFKIIPE